MADTDALRPYTPQSYPTMGEDKRYLQLELRNISNVVTTMRDVLKKLEARIAALGG